MFNNNCWSVEMFLNRFLTHNDTLTMYYLIFSVIYRLIDYLSVCKVKFFYLEYQIL